MPKTVIAGLAGITPDYLYQIERGLKLPTVTVLKHLADVLGVSADELLHSSTKREASARPGPKGDALYRAFTRPLRSDDTRLHWHPVGPSPIKGPHIHFPPNFDRHLPSPRFTFEQAVTWLIEFDVPLRVSREEALVELAEIEAAHVLHRTWSDTPPVPTS
jgi:hypothetical protein